MKNIEELIQEGCKLFADLRSGAVTPKEAKEANNSLGKVISAAKAQIEYATLKKGDPSIVINFLECDK